MKFKYNQIHDVFLSNIWFKYFFVLNFVVLIAGSVNFYQMFKMVNIFAIYV